MEEGESDAVAVALWSGEGVLVSGELESTLVSGAEAEESVDESGAGVFCSGELESIVVPGAEADEGLVEESGAGVFCSGELDSTVVPRVLSG